MSILVKLTAASFAVGIVGAAFVAPAQATTEHCPSGGEKFEVDAGPSYDVGDEYAGYEYCLKAGTKIQTGTVGDDGWIANTTIMNRPGNAYLGISYYVIYPCEGYECGGGGSGS